MVLQSQKNMISFQTEVFISDSRCNIQAAKIAFLFFVGLLKSYNPIAAGAQL